MDYEAAQASRERAISSEPSSTRPNPFDDSDNSSRKRRRVSHSSSSRSRSVDTTKPSTRGGLMAQPDGSTKLDSDPPRTPTRSTFSDGPAEPTSSKVTINLRSRPLDAIASSTSSPTTFSPSDHHISRESVESESDALSTIQAMETPSSSASASGSPEVEVELVMNGDESDFAPPSPPVAIIGEEVFFSNPMDSFPYHSENETLVLTVRRVIHFVHYESMENGEFFAKLRDWIEQFLAYTNGNLRACHGCFVRYRDFWMIFPEIIQALSWRSRFFGSFLQKIQDSRQALSDMLSQFARLTGRFVTMDVMYLSHYAQNDLNDQELDLASRGYLQAYSFLLRKEEHSHIGRNLETHYRWNWDEDMAMLTSNFQIAGGTIHNLTKLIDLQLKLMPRQPKVIDNLAEPCRLVARTVYEAFITLEDSEANHRQYLDTARQQVAQGFDFFKMMSEGLKIIIEKHVTNLSPDCASIHLSSLSSIFRNALACDMPAAREATEQYRREYPGHPRKHYAKVVSFEWKFNILTSLITSAQMQLRVVGVTTMCQDLLSMYNTANRSGEPSQSPLLQHFAQFILRNKLVDYIVGTASHPEIINESNNLVGFLIVTKTYTSQQTDRIWHTVMTSQDPRVVDAILRMLAKCSNLFDYQTLLHFCKKASSLPIDAFTVPMRDYCENLFQFLMSKSDHESPRCVGAAPYDLCVRLIRQSSVISAACPTGYPDIQNFAAARFRELLLHGPGSSVRNEIYLSCISDISSRAPTAAGSICVINTLLRQNLGTDLHILTTKHGLTELLVEELESSITGDRSSCNPSVRNSPASQARRELLLAIMVQEPSTISPELGARLWNLLVGSEPRSFAERNTSWQILNSAVKKTSLRNVFIATCFQEYLPKLSPEYFTLGALDFAQAGVLLWLDEVRRDFIADDRLFESLALEQLWHMILTAPPNTIDEPAINILVDVYVESALILSLPRAKARSVHLALVHRCIEQLAGAATKLKAFNEASSKSDYDMDPISSDAEFQEQEKIFARSLAVLREFLRAYQSKPHFALLKSAMPIISASSPVEGEPMEIKYQSFDGDNHSEVRSLILGSLNTAASLLGNLQHATGFDKYKVYCAGKEFNPDEVDICKPLGELNIPGLVLIQRRDDLVSSPGQVGNKTTLELEIMEHFDELFGYLGMHETVAQEIYYFLVKFPVSDLVLQNFDSDTTTYTEIFPLGQPFKSLYTVHAIREYIKVQSQKGSINEPALIRAIALIVAAIRDREVVEQCATEELRNCLALHLVDCFVQLVKEPFVPLQAGSYLDQSLLQRLLELHYASRTATPSQNSLHLTWSSFEAILEASLHSPEFWTSFKRHIQSTSLLRDLVLNDDRAVVRKSIAKQIISKCSFIPSLARVSSMDFVLTFWPLVDRLIVLAVRKPHSCEESFSLCLAIFKKLAETASDQLELNGHIRQWGALLLSHATEESIGQPECVDMVAQGLANLLYAATSYAKASQTVISCSELGPDLFEKHMFPPISTEKPDTLARQTDSLELIIPILNPLTRQTLAEAIFFLIKDDERQYKALLMQLQSLVPYDDTIEDGPYQYELPPQFDRSKAIRSSTGYVGLRNLSNTCYLNSLFTQLYMNVPFREFMLNAHVVDRSSQKLLSETQSLFSYMQNILKRFVDPVDLASSIRTYEETNIDVSIQMDVDEFYNLIFDRWESQILAPEAKKKFRSFYGGQLVQQVKSKECPHISERLEPFSAIQCDIKGKSSLQESLQAYVDGEVMEGDNKYKCSTCDRHVDAVKRACLKDIPDNLIFHLKRFEFNLRTLQRSKINDYFSFPNKIDMRPYKLEYLVANEESPEDVFELVGILVHSGTAESGHYYSFVSERPSPNEQDNWVEFNDDTVTPWDPSCIEGSCFGGVDFRGPLENGNVQYDKSYSAYMLFYQRSSLVASQKARLLSEHEASPIRLPILPHLAHHIAEENELLIRKYCLYDSSTAKFVTKMLANMKNINKGNCSATHALEKEALTVSLHHLDQVIARAKDLPEYANFIVVLRQICHECPECSRDLLDWFSEYPDTLRHLLLRNPDTTVRADTAGLIVSALIKVKVEASYAYGLGIDEDGGEDLEEIPPMVIQRIVKAIDKLWDMFHTSCRAWPEYFGLLASISNMGDAEAALLVDLGFLRKTLEIATADINTPSSVQYSRMLNIISKRTATRPVSYEAVLGLLARLLQIVDPAAEAVDDGEGRLDLPFNGAALPLAKYERAMIQQNWTRSQANILVEKLLHINQLYPSTHRILVKLLHWPMQIDHNIFQAISVGIRKGPVTSPCRQYLRAALTYCEHSEAPQGIRNMVSHVSRVARLVDTSEGREFLHFYKAVLDLPYGEEISRQEAYLAIISNIHQWAPALLTYYEANVRTETGNLIHHLVLRHDPDLDTRADGLTAEEEELTHVIVSSARKLGVACLDYLNEVYIRQRQQAVRATMTSIQNVIEACAKFYNDGDDALGLRFNETRAVVLPALLQATVEEAEEEISDWDGSDAEYGSSEPMDSIAELCGNVTDDLDN